MLQMGASSKVGARGRKKENILEADENSTLHF
jgi:hypothetical protein